MEKITVALENNKKVGSPILWASLVFMLYLLLLSVTMVGGGFKMATGDQAKVLFEFASHPIAGLMIGLVATALIQSSSTVTSIIVGLVAGGLPVETAIPMIMGANIGTTVTNTIVSLAHIREKDEFKNAFASATIHDFFNILAVIIFLPLEIMFGIFEKVSEWLVSFFVSTGDMSIKSFNFIKPITKPVVKAIESHLSFLNSEMIGVSLIIGGIFTIFIAITFMGKLMKKLMVGRAKEILKNAIGKGPLHGIFSGTLVTVLVQSSSTTTSLIIPLVGNKILKVKEIYPFTIGSNIGTCITALLAATAVTGDFAVFALQIALVHLSFNLAATIVIFGIPFLRKIPLNSSHWISDLAIKNRGVVFVYLISLFVVIPSAILFLTV
ncbi:MAG: sodium:phosphate symporter [Chloroflexi bacterium]|nr:sodium:phosphate symporter [Chloroflexota bacterium]|tara:strand:+ start:33416 stop:34561 length:1146 start_codon:yes stop_codon:yes gene_type:complete